MTKTAEQQEIKKELQEMGYAGKYVYVPVRLTGAKRKMDWIAEDLEGGLSVSQIREKYRTTVTYIYSIAAKLKNGGISKNQHKLTLPSEMIDRIKKAFPQVSNGGYVFVPAAPIQTDGKKGRSCSGRQPWGDKATALWKEFYEGAGDVQALAEKYQTSVGYVKKVKVAYQKYRRKQEEQ